MSHIALSLVLPAYNEQENILESINAALELPISDIEIIVVDDGSEDRTNELVHNVTLSDERIRLVTHSENKGYGAALVSGFNSARGKYVFFTDSDRQFNLSELSLLWSFRENADIVVGYRYPRQDPRHRRFNAWAWGRLVRRLTGIQVQDINCAFKLFRSDVLKNMNLQAKGAFINTEILAKAMASEHRILEIPVNHFPRVAGEQTGAKPAVVVRAFWELMTVYRQI